MEDLGAAMEFALGVLRRRKSHRQSFSLKGVRDIINSELGLNLTEDDEAQIKASLFARNDVRPVSLEGKMWRFGVRPEPKSREIRR